jgi:predicted HTH transcriptional regulator
MPSKAKLIERAENARRESKSVEFKSEFDPTSLGMWCELLKDIVAFANSGGGIIVFGVRNDGSASGSDMDAILAIDAADIANKIRRYTDYEFSDIEIVEINRGGACLAAFLVSEAEVPLIFTKPGTYEVEPPRQKTAFSQGTIYFRHGTKSEPGTRDDLAKWRDKEIAKVRKSWLGGIRKVVETPPGHAITVVSSPVECVYRKPKPGRSGDEVRQGSRVN